MVKVRISPLSPLAVDILSLGDILYKLDADAGPLLLQARDTAGSYQDAEDVGALEIAHHVATHASTYIGFHHQFAVQPLHLSIFFIAIIIVKD